MLRELSIRNLAVIEHVTVSFHEGFHVLTGETGAGKSIVIDALALAAGGRGAAEMIRHGSDRASIEAVFDLPEGHPAWGILVRLGIEADPGEPLIIRRELHAQGKSSARINGQNVTLSMLREVGDCLVNLHGQHEHQSLLRTDRHLEWLDQYAGEAIAEEKAVYRERFDEYQKAAKERKQLDEMTRQGMQMLDLYKFQIEEIDAAQLKPGEDEALADERRKLSHSEKLSEAVSEAYEWLYGKGLSALSKSLSRLQDVTSVDPAVLEPLVEQLQSSYYAAEDAAYQLRHYRDNIEFNPERLAQIEQRLDLLFSLKRKYGETAEEILAYRHKIHEEAERLENRDERLRDLEAREQELLKDLTARAERLSAIRRDAGKMLAREIVRELSELQMDRSVFEVRLEPGPLTANGADSAEFLLSTNPGEPPKPLAKIASGGEMSRVMLALKAIFSRFDQIPVLVFDEVDTGVSGRAAQAVADKLSRLSRSCQVFSITHLPQVACMADHQYEIRKEVSQEGRTVTSVTELRGGERIEEIARLLGGVEVTEKTRHHAQEMLALAERQKNA